MSNPKNTSPFALEPIEDRIDILFKELELALKWQRPSILLAIYSSEYVHLDAAIALENQLIELGSRTIRIDLKESTGVDIAAMIEALGKAEQAVFFVDGLRWAVQKDGTNIYRILNNSRENFINRQIRVVFWLTENEAIDLARYAPDYWAYRHRVVEFIESPEPEQILLRSLTSAWQILGEDTDTIENTDEKIALRSGMLAELPESSEATGIRSSLLLSLGILYWRKGALDTALEHLQAALGIATRIGDPRLQAACFNALAIVQTDLGQYAEAINHYQQTIALAPNQTFTWNNLGNLYEKLDRGEDAILAFGKALEFSPSDALAWNGLGNVYLKLHQTADAIAAYRKSIEFAADLAYPWNGLGNAFASQDDFEAAIPAYQKSVELNKDFSVPWVNLGDIYQEQGKSQEALKAYWNAVRIDSKNAQIWNSLGNVYMGAGLCEEAIKSYDKALKLNRNLETAYTNLAAAYSLLGKYEEAVGFYQKSVELLSGQKQPAAKSQMEQTYRQFVKVDQDEPEVEEIDDEVEVVEDVVDVQIKAMLEEQEIASALAAEADDDELDDEEDAEELSETDDLVELPDAVSETLVFDTLTDEAGLPEIEAVEANASLTVSAVETTFLEVSTSDDNAQESHTSPEIVIVFQDIEHLIEIDVHGREADHFEAEETFSAVETVEKLVSPTGEVPLEPELAAETPAEELPSATLQPRIERMPKDAFVWNELGNIYLNISEYVDAIAAYKQAIELDPSLGWSYSNLALAYSLQGQYEDALHAYGKIIYLLSSPEEKVSWRSPASAQANSSRVNSLRHAVDSLAVQTEPIGMTLCDLPVEDIYASPEISQNEIEIEDLVKSVREYGILQPLIVTPNGKPGKFILVSGIRRLAAARKAGLQTVPAIVREANQREKTELALIEKALQAELNPLELAETYRRLTEEFHYSLEALAIRVGRSGAEVSGTLSLLELSEKVKAALFERTITEAHAHALLALSTSLAQDILLKTILEKQLSVQQTEELVHNSVGRKPSFLFTENEYESVGTPESSEPIALPGSLRRKALSTGDFSLISRARAVLKSNHPAAHSLDGFSLPHLAQEGGVHE